MEEARIPGVAEGAQRHVEVTGVDFYQTVQQLPGLRTIFAIAQTKRFDLYETMGMANGWVVHQLSRAHSGLLPRYLIWFALGVLLIISVVMEGSR